MSGNRRRFAPAILILAFVAMGCRRPANPVVLSSGDPGTVHQEGPAEPNPVPPKNYSFTEFGREDPFALLPEENQAASKDSTPKAEPSIGDPTDARAKITVRGIFLGASPRALIEENSSYRQVKPGDELAGGRVIRITSAGVTILRDDIPVTLRMGE